MGKKPRKVAASKPPRKRKARKPPANKVVFTPDQMEAIGNLGEMGCSQEEIAAMLTKMGVACHRATLQRHLASNPKLREVYDVGVLSGKVRLRSRMVKQAQMMNGAGVHQSQFLAKNWLGMKDKLEVDHKGNIDSHVELSTARQRVTAKLEALEKRLASRALIGGSEAVADVDQHLIGNSTSRP